VRGGAVRQRRVARARAQRRAEHTARTAAVGLDHALDDARGRLHRACERDAHRVEQRACGRGARLGRRGGGRDELAKVHGAA
jgi:hypothetical protein